MRPTFNADRRDKIAKQKHRATNWSEYNEGLRLRGDLRFGSVTPRLICGRLHAEQPLAVSHTTSISR
jgi:hypothetical protein